MGNLMRKKTYLKLVEYQTAQYRRHLCEVQGIYREMRGYKHDFHHHLQTLKGQLTAGGKDRPPQGEEGTFFALLFPGGI